MSKQRYVELHCKSNFSFLEGASHPDELVEQAVQLGYAGLALTDVNSVAGVVRGFTVAKELKAKFIVGAELRFVDGPSIVVWPSDRKAYGRLCRLLTLGRSRREKGECDLFWGDLEMYAEGLLAGLSLQPSSVKVNDDAWPSWAFRFKDLFRDAGYLLVHSHLGVDDRAQIEFATDLASQCGIATVAAGEVAYHVPERMQVFDLVTAIANRTTVADIVDRRLPNAQWCLRSIEELEHRYRQAPGTLERTLEIADRCQFSLDQLKYEYPMEAAPAGATPMEYLRQLAWEGAKRRYPQSVPVKIRTLIEHELTLIEDLRYEAYFLTVWDLVRFARSRNILCQGRGSAANSTVCYCLGVTSVDPNELDLLFERFISRERGEAPDIDVDFEHQRREEVLQYIYDKYGRERSGMTATVICYRLRSAVRDVAKAIGLSLDRIDALSKVIDGRGGHESLVDRCRLVGIDPDSEIGRTLIYLVNELLGFPRHLSQHTGGMVMTQGALCELCPIENAAMEGRTVIQWDKDDLDALGILKVDCLALGMLSAIHRSFDLIEKHFHRTWTLATIPQGDEAVYDMICQADTLGVFQIESRAQMSMLPRLRPRCYYDLVIEVAIVRPGPIQGQMVHPYLRARKTGEQPEYPTPEIAEVLRKTLGVPIFQEQAMRLAVVAAGFTPGEADQLRRAMAAWRRPGVIDQFRKKLIDGMLIRGLSREFAENVFMQLRGFGEYGFPESHAASFALLVYVSCWIKHHHPEVFCCAMLNSQPLGFYAPAQLVQDAVRHRVRVLPPDINQSEWDCTLEKLPTIEPSSTLALRLGFRMVEGLGEGLASQLVAERDRNGAYIDTSDVVQRVGLGQGAVALLAKSGVFQSISGDRRAAMWQALAVEKSDRKHELFQFSHTDNDELIPASLTPMKPIDEVYSDYATTGLSLQGHPFQFIRATLDQQRVTKACDVALLPHGKPVRVAGLVLLRQRPSTAKGITFVTLEDETGSLNLVIHSGTWEHHYAICKQSNAWLVHGIVENRDSIIHIVVGRIEDVRRLLQGLRVESRDFR